MWHKQLQPVADTSALTNKSLNMLKTQNVAIDSTKYPVPNQLIIEKQKYPLQDRYKIEMGNIPCQPNPYFRPPPRPPDNLQLQSLQTNTTNDTSIDIEFEENLPHQEGIISQIYQRPDKSYFQEPKDLESLIDTSELVQKFLPKQTNIDKILKIIQQKVLKGSHLSITVKEIQAGYLTSLYFKDIYLYLSHNILPSSKVHMKKVEALVENIYC